jgi:hypothetical protein
VCEEYKGFCDLDILKRLLGHLATSVADLPVSVVVVNCSSQTRCRCGIACD